MKQWFYKVFTLTVVGMVVYLIFSKDDSLYYHFPWELFAGIGIMSWAVQEGLKMVKAVKKEMEQCKNGSDLGRLCHHSSWSNLVERRVS